MATILANGLVQFEDGHILYSDTPINGQDFMELQELLPRINPIIGRSAMVGFPFISGGGGAGAPGARGADGLAGPTGLEGPTGPQGVTGPSMGVQGATGVQGPQGATGIQGIQGQTGIQGATGAPNPHDIFASDRVVDPAGNGTDLTLASAIAAVNAFPNKSGTIYVKSGTYAISATMVLPLGNVTIIGAGGNTGGPLVDPSATVFDLGANAIPLFQTPAGGGGTVFASYKFQQFKVVGTSVVGQAFLQAPPAALGSTSICEDLHIDSVQMIVQTNGQDVEVTFRDCTLNPTTASASFWNGAGPGGELTWDHVQSQLPVAGSAIAIAGGPSWDVINSYLGGPAGFSTITVQDINWVAFFLGKNGDKLQVTVNAAISTIVSCQFIGVTLNIDTTLFFFSNSWMSGAATGALNQLNLSGVGAIGNMNVSGVNFDASGAAAAVGIVMGTVSNIDIHGCQFEGHTTAGIQASIATTLSVTGCRFVESVPLAELDPSVVGRYTGNVGFTGSVIVGPDSVVEEVRRKEVTGGATVDALTPVFTHLNAKGLTGAGSIKNTGGVNSLVVRRTATDGYGVTDFVENTVLPGASLVWILDAAIGTALPCFVSFTVSVRSASAGNPTTFDLRHSSAGAY